jgi:small nuclear ribonucleoprotein D2
MRVRNSPLTFLSESIVNNRPVVVFIRNNKKLLGYIRAFDRHMNLVLENTKELWTTLNSQKKQIYHEKFLPKLVLRGDSVILILYL